MLYFDEQYGAVDVDMHPRDPNVLFATLYRAQRDGFSGGDGNPVIETGPHAGIYRSSDGGTTWSRVTNGLPTTQLGRVGVAFSRSQPDIMYAVVQAEATIRRPNGQPKGDTLSLNHGGIFRSNDGGNSWTAYDRKCLPEFGQAHVIRQSSREGPAVPRHRPGTVRFN